MKRTRTQSGVLATVQAAGKGIVIQITGDGEAARRALEMVREQLRETSEESGHTAESFERVKSALETVGLYMGVRELLSEVRELTLGSLELGEEIERAGKKTGLTSESLSVLRYAANVTGGDFEGLTAGLAKMNNTIAKAADGDAKAGGFLRGIGVNAKQVAQDTNGTQIAFEAFMRTLASTESTQRRTELAMGLLGKAGAQQIPLLLELAENWDTFRSKAQAAGVLLDGEAAARLASTNQRLQDMKQHLVGAGLALTEGMSPALNQMFQVISGGESQMDTMTHWGQGIGRILAFIAEAATTAAAGIELAFSAVEGGKLTEAGARDYARANQLYDQAKRYYEIAQGKTPAGASTGPFLPEPEKNTPKGRAFEGLDLGGKGKGVNAIEEARTQLADEASRVQQAKRKAADQVQLAELDAQHKELLVSDQAFYAERLRLQLDELDAEATQLDSKAKNLQDLLAKQHANPTLKRGKDGVSAEELKTQRELLQIQEQRAAMTAKRGQLTSANDADVVLSQQNAEIAGLRIAAELEKERNAGIEAQIALTKRENDEQVKKVRASGGSEADVAAVRATGDLAEQKLRLGEVTRQISDIEADYRRRIDDTNDAVAKGDKTKEQGARQIARMQQEEADRLQALVQQYSALAQSLGGEYVQKAKDAQEELNKLGRHDRTQDGDYKFAEGLKSMTDSIDDSTVEAQQSFSKMAESILRDVDRMALKFVEKKFIDPLFEPGDGSGSGGGISLGNLLHPFSGGGPARSAQMWTPPKPSSGSGTGEAIAGIAQAASKNLVPKLTTNLQNNSSQPLQMGEPEVSYDDKLGEFVVNYIMNDHSTGGPISQLYGQSS